MGAALAIAIGYRGAIFSSGVLVALVATAVIFLVPADIVRRHGRGPAETETALEPFRPTLQLALAIFLYFSLFALNAFRSVATPIALKDIAGAQVTAVTGIAFFLGGIASAIGVWLLAGRFFSKRRLRSVLVACSVASGAGHLFLALADSAWLYVVAFTVASLLNAAMMPATNALIAFNVSRARRGTAFGLASGAQAVAFMVGPMGAALFAASLKLGFAIVGVLLVGLAALIGLAIREPKTGSE
ncbi:MAG: MFS transporter [Betaproteobacteria bacterium]|nr:MFS transporter [Betaproteobacteria bacterium]